MFALKRAQLQVGEKTFDTFVPGIRGLFVSFSRSVTAKAAAVATSRPTRIVVVRSRCKAQRFYGPSMRIRPGSGALAYARCGSAGRGRASRARRP